MPGVCLLHDSYLLHRFLSAHDSFSCKVGAKFFAQRGADGGHWQAERIRGELTEFAEQPFDRSRVGLLEQQLHQRHQPIIRGLCSLNLTGSVLLVDAEEAAGMYIG